MKSFLNRRAVTMGLFVTLGLLSLNGMGANRWSYNNGGVIGWSSTDPGLGAPTNAGAPGVSDDIVITNTGLNVTFGNWNMNAGGSITINSSASLSIGNLDVCSSCAISISGTMSAGNVTVANGGSFYVAPGGNASTADFTNNNNSTGVTIDGNMNVTGDLDNGTNSVIDGAGGLDVDGSITNGGTIGGSGGTDVGTLPVELTSFELSNANSLIELTWQTATELNNDYFDVERSEDGTNFYKIARIEGNGTTSETQNYQFTDKAPIANVEYYRLKQVDYDGTFEYSKVIVGYADLLANQLQMTAYPNPAAERVSIKSVRPVAFTEIKLINIAGQTVANLTEEVQGFGLQLEVALPVLEKGMYYIKYLTVDGQTGSQKLMIK
jgi:hypothetical protein